MLGRETFADDVEWTDGWPVLTGHLEPAPAGRRSRRTSTGESSRRRGSAARLARGGRGPRGRRLAGVRPRRSRCSSGVVRSTCPHGCGRSSRSGGSAGCRCGSTRGTPSTSPCSDGRVRGCGRSATYGTSSGRRPARRRRARGPPGPTSRTILDRARSRHVIAGVVEGGAVQGARLGRRPLPLDRGGGRDDRPDGRGGVPRRQPSSLRSFHYVGADDPAALS